GLFLLEGGAQYDTLFPGQSVRLGVRAIDVSPLDGSRSATARVTVAGPGGATVWHRQWPLALTRGATERAEAAWTPPALWPAGGYRVTAELLESGRVIDRVQHALAVWAP